MTSNIEAYIIDVYDKYVASEGDLGAAVETSRDAVAHQYASDVENGVIERPEVDLVEEGRRLFNQAVTRTRGGRREAFKKNVEYILDALADETILGPSDPIFSEPHPLGDGRDKVLGLWTAEDWLGAVNERNSNAVAAAAAAHEFEVVARQVVDHLKKASARTTRQLFERAA